MTGKFAREIRARGGDVERARRLGIVPPRMAAEAREEQVAEAASAGALAKRPERQRGLDAGLQRRAPDFGETMSDGRRADRAVEAARCGRVPA